MVVCKVNGQHSLSKQSPKWKSNTYFMWNAFNLLHGGLDVGGGAYDHAYSPRPDVLATRHMIAVLAATGRATALIVWRNVEAFRQP